VIVFDQPESNMDKPFLLNVLASKFDELRRTHQLFIATHEPLLVVNADSNEIILAENGKTIGKENHITYSNRSFVGARGKSELVENIAELIDGGSKAVKRRSDIYEGMKS
jgi:ABC-type polar amino acid transport system ATPase subunit